MTALLLTAGQMRALERTEIESGRASGGALMQLAGEGVAAAIAARWRPGHAVVLCGPGNNGGDGYVVALGLSRRGWTVTCRAWRGRDLPPDAAAARHAWETQGRVLSWGEGPEATHGADLVVDAVFGAGLTRAVPDEVHYSFVSAAAPVVSVDAPTGLCMDSGRPLGGQAVRAALTVTFHALRRGHVLGEGPGHCGEVVCVDIGLPPPREGVPLVDAPLVALGKDAAHKYRAGHALIIGGGPGRGGAARMAARAALRIGAGLVTVATPPAALQENAARLDAVMLRPVAHERALADLLADTRFNAVGLGPGAQALIGATLAAGRGTVLDADALTAFAAAPASLFDALHDRCLLTPHDGEFARLFPDIAARLEAPTAAGPAPSRIDAAVAAAARAGCTVLLKGPDTVIADASGRVAVHAAVRERAAPWLATAGAGDVLTGIATGLMARGAAPFEAAATAAWLHVEAARAVGPGLIAEDLPDALPRVLAAVLGSA